VGDQERIGLVSWAGLWLLHGPYSYFRPIIPCLVCSFLDALKH
jgi:hypothetical protein